MVKRQKEKQYQSRSELKSHSSSNNHNGGSSSVRKLPFDCCALSLLPFQTPVCTHNGIIFEKSAIETFVEEHKKDPVAGKPMTKQDLITLTMDKDDEGRWQCPILTKPFSDHTPIVAIVHGQQANVYSQEAYQELNVKAKNYEDLISGEKFHKKKDVLFLNSDSPEFQKLRDINSFYHIQNQRQLEQAKPKSSNSNIRHSVTATRILDKVQKDKAQDDSIAATKKRSQPNLQQEGKRLKIFSDDVTGVKMTSGKGSGSFTSTAMNVQSNNEAREATQEEVLKALCQVLQRQRKKGYVKLQTNRGDLLLEIHCDLVPRTATNFMKLCAQQKYNGTSFHRLIPKFMIQGGSSSDDEDECIWGGAFKDEFHAKLKHDEPGILSMANAGPHTNRRQFFITFAPCEYLNRKHSVFGVVVKGLELLKEIEKIPTNAKDKPVEPITILDTVIVENPVEQAEEKERKRIEARHSKSESEKRNRRRRPPKWKLPPVGLVGICPKQRLRLSVRTMTNCLSIFLFLRLVVKQKATSKSPRRSLGILAVGNACQCVPTKDSISTEWMRSRGFGKRSVPSVTDIENDRTLQSVMSSDVDTPKSCEQVFLD